ncbi:MAG: hypothetical protein M1479_01330 [Actinobacteria bacterium]|nr:hypothetical protein [Actinomycetota bacterium]
MENLKSKIGIVLASHTREPASFSLELVNKWIELLKKENLDIYFNRHALKDDKEIREEILRLKKNNPDLYIIIPGNWIEPPSLCHPLEEIRNENILLLGFPESLKLISEGHFLGSNSAFTVLRNAMNQMGFKFTAIQEFPDREVTLKKIKDLICVSHLLKLIRRVKIGIIGYCSMGIYTTCFDQLKIRNVFGIEIDTSADSYILFKYMEEVKEEEISEIESLLQKTCSINDEIIKNGSLKKSISMYIALKKMIDEGDWKGVSVKCQHEFSTYLRCTACLPLTMLTDEGIMCSDEGDMHALITMIIMHNLTEKNVPIYFGDIYKLEEGGFLMGHCGLSPHSCASKDTAISLIPENPRISKDGKTTGGVISSYKFKEGPVTIGRIENDINGSYVFHFSKGTVRPVASVAFGVSTLVFEPDGDNDFFADNQLANHYVFVYDDIMDKLKTFSKLLNIKMIF